MAYDLVIKNGMVVDGSGFPRYRANVAVKDGTIVEIGKIRGAATTTIDADGLFVTPGIIDTHTHYDAQPFWDKLCTSSIWHGVTTVLMGNCGLTLAPLRPEHRETMLATFCCVEDLPVRSLAKLLGWRSQAAPRYGVLMQSATAKFVLAVDGFVGREDVVIKPLQDIKPKGVQQIFPAILLAEYTACALERYRPDWNRGAIIRPMKLLAKYELEHFRSGRKCSKRSCAANPRRRPGWGPWRSNCAASSRLAGPSRLRSLGPNGMRRRRSCGSVSTPCARCPSARSPRSSRPCA